MEACVALTGAREVDRAGEGLRELDEDGDIGRYCTLDADELGNSDRLFPVIRRGTALAGCSLSRWVATRTPSSLSLLLRANAKVLSPAVRYNQYKTYR